MLRSLQFRMQFSLASLFIVVTLVAIVSAGYGMRHRVIAAEDRAMRTIASKGGVVEVWDDGVTIRFASQTPPIFHCGLEAWGLRYQPSGSAVDFHEADLEMVSKIRNVQKVDFRNTSVSLAAIEQFRAEHPHCRVEY